MNILSKKRIICQDIFLRFANLVVNSHLFRKKFYFSKNNLLRILQPCKAENSFIVMLEKSLKHYYRR
jgi:hypothetical protein